jgi:hypothetical protein
MMAFFFSIWSENNFVVNLPIKIMKVKEKDVKEEHFVSCSSSFCFFISKIFLKKINFLFISN